MNLSLGGRIGGVDFGPSMKKYQAAKRRHRAATKAGRPPEQTIAQRDMDLAELEMIALGGTLQVAAVWPFGPEAEAIKRGGATPRMQDARDKLTEVGRWPIK